MQKMASQRYISQNFSRGSMPLAPLVASAFEARWRSYTASQTSLFSADRIGISAQKRRSLFTSLHALKDVYRKCVFSKQSMLTNLWINSQRPFLRRSKAVAIVEKSNKIYIKLVDK